MVSSSSSSSSNLSASVPAGQYPPLFVITPTDQRGIIVIVTAVCLVTAVVSLFVRAYLILQSGRFRAHGDDMAIAITILLVIIQTSLVQGEASLGLGRRSSDVTNSEAQQIQRLQFTDQIFFILSIWMSKIAAALFLYRLSPKKSDRRMSEIVLGIAAVLGLASLLIVCFVCDISHAWLYFSTEGVTCTAPYNRWIAACTLDIISEVILACLATKIFWPLQISASRKAVACAMFYQRLLIIVSIAVRIHYLSQLFHGVDPTLYATNSTLCKEVQIAFAIVTSNVPAFRPFLLATATNYGTPAEGARGTTSHYHDATRQSIKLADMSSSSKSSKISPKRSKADEESSGRECFSPIDKNFATTSSSSNRKQRGGTSIDSDGSTGMIIRKDVGYDVQYYNREASSADTGRHL